MPELPEVETIRQDLRKNINGHRFIEVEVLKDKAVRGSLYPLPKLKGETIEDIERIGKLIMFRLKNNRYILVHLKMTGQLIYTKGEKMVAGGHSFPHLKNPLPDKHTQVIFRFTGGGTLYFNDMRRFGYVRLVDLKTKNTIVAAYGLEPLQPEATYEKFKAVLVNKKSVLKAVLLDQKKFAGIGNIYADEICHAARVLPDRKCQSLAEKEVRSLFSVTKRILKNAVKHRGTSFSDYVDGSGKKGNFVKYLRVYDREGEMCKTCRQTKILKKTVSGRGTGYCPNCQR